MNERGQFIVIYGANNMGKSLQTDMLKAALEKTGKVVERVKYPVYDLEPTGPQINAVLRLGKQMPEETLQELYAQNRRDFQPTLVSYLESGKWVVGEDYKGTGIAWGMVREVSLQVLESINSDLLSEDFAILLYGERFDKGKEQSHRNEIDDEIWKKGQEMHLFLADRYKWPKVYATRPPEQVHADIMDILKKKGVV